MVNFQYKFEPFSEQFQANQVSIAIYNSEWYSFPLDIQKLLPTIIQRSQKPVVISGFKLFNCTLENFTRVSFFFYWQFKCKTIAIDLSQNLIANRNALKFSEKYLKFIFCRRWIKLAPCWPLCGSYCINNMEITWKKIRLILTSSNTDNE